MALVGSRSDTTEEQLDLNYYILEGDVRDRIQEIPSNSVHLMVTSPPYGMIKNYTQRSEEIGIHQTFNTYHDSLMDVWRETIRILKPGCRMVINIGDEFVRTTKDRPYHVVPHNSFLIRNLIDEFNDELIYNGTIHWEKVTTSKTSGGGKVMGSVFTPRDGHFFVNYEHIIVFKKLGKSPKVSKWQKQLSRFTIEERRIWFRDTWRFQPARQSEHIAMFPMELPERIIQMYSFIGEKVFDPFLGSGTTLAAAAKFNRSGIGIELGFTSNDSWKDIVYKKISQESTLGQEIYFN